MRAATLLLALMVLACSRPDPGETLLRIRSAEDLRVYSDSLATWSADGDLDVRRAALRAIGRIGDPAGRPALEAALDEDEPGLRAEAAFSLGILGDEDAGPALAARLPQENDADAMGEIVLALGRLNLRGATREILPLLEKGHPHVREQVLESLALLADTTAVDALIAATHDDLESVAWRAAYALEKIPGEKQVARLVELLEHDSSLVRRYAMRSLGRLSAQSGVEPIVRSMRARPRDWQLQVMGCDALGRIGDPWASTALGEALQHASFHVRTAAAEAIGRSKARDQLPQLLDRLQDDSVNVRAAAYRAVADCLEGRATTQLLDGLQDESDLVVSACLERLGNCDDPRVIPTLLAVLESSDRPATRPAAVQGLIAAAERAPHEALRQLARDEDWVVATTAVEALGALSAAESVPDLIEIYERRAGAGRQDIALAILRSFEILEDDRAIPVCLRAMSEESDVRLRLAAAAALRKLLPESDAATLPTDREIQRDVRQVARSPLQPPVVASSHARQLTLHTDRGEIVIDLLGEEAPQMVENFASLAEDGFFEGLSFHRVVPNFVIQGGDPLGTGWGDAGYTVRSEWNRLRYDRGMVGIAHSGKDTGSCQLFITHSPQPHLNARYTIWGRVVSGMDVVDRIEMGDRFRASVRREDAGR